MQMNNILTYEEEQLLQSVIDEQMLTDKRMIPQNTESILVDSISSRFSSADWYNNVKSKEVLNGFDEIKKNSENYVTEIEYNEDFRNIKVIADREKLPEGSISMLDDTVLKIISQAMAYQIYTVEGQKLKITIICSDNEEVVFQSDFPIVIE